MNLKNNDKVANATDRTQRRLWTTGELASRSRPMAEPTARLRRVRNMFDGASRAGMTVVLALLLSAPASAAGICIVCPPGYDCSGAKPVAKTGDARLATIGDIPTTAAQVGAVPTTRTIAGFNLSGDITVQQLRDVLDACNLPAAGTPGEGTVEYRCSITSGTANTAGNPSTTSGAYCWCRYRKDDFTKILTGATCGVTRYSAWVSADANAHANDCGNYCSPACSLGTNWRESSIW